MAIIATLLSIVAPKYFNSLDRSKETVLRQDLNIMRDAIDKFNSDTGKYPEDLAELVEKRYLRAIPVDPLTESAETWIAVPAPDAAGGIYDVHSGSSEQAKDGTLTDHGRRLATCGHRTDLAAEKAVYLSLGNVHRRDYRRSPGWGRTAMANRSTTGKGKGAHVYR